MLSSIFACVEANLLTDKNTVCACKKQYIAGDLIQVTIRKKYYGIAVMSNQVIRDIGFNMQYFVLEYFLYFKPSQVLIDVLHKYIV